MFQSTLTVFSGGTAFNSVCRELTEGFTSCVNHILPVSDNGGSSREIIRVLGGPAIGDTVSFRRLVYLDLPSDLRKPPSGQFETSIPTGGNAGNA